MYTKSPLFLHTRVSRAHNAHALVAKQKSAIGIELRSLVKKHSAAAAAGGVLMNKACEIQDAP